MATVVDICNLALARLGDEAGVQSIDPPDGSPQAAQCAAFYPMARDTLLTLSSWTFATVRARLSPLAFDADLYPGWSAVYALPNACLQLRKVLAAGTVDDGTAQGEPFRVETRDDGAVVVLSRVELAVGVYVARVEDTARFSPLFVDALAWLLASHLAGPIVKGDAGRAASRACGDAFRSVMGAATTADGAQVRLTAPVPSIIAVRG